MVVKQSWWGKLMNITGAVAGSALGLIAATFIQGSLPVVVGMQAEQVVFDDGSFEAQIIGRKVKDCAVVADSFVGWQLSGEVWVEVPFEFTDDPSPNDTRPTSWAQQDFGTWKWDDVPESADEVRLSLQHNCDGHLTVTAITFDLGGEK